MKSAKKHCFKGDGVLHTSDHYLPHPHEKQLSLAKSFFAGLKMFARLNPSSAFTGLQIHNMSVLHIDIQPILTIPGFAYSRHGHKVSFVKLSKHILNTNIQISD